jgi:hypothetical protein
MQNTRKRTAADLGNTTDQFAHAGQIKRPCLQGDHAHLSSFLSRGHGQTLDEFQCLSPLEAAHFGESAQRPRVLESPEANSSHPEEADSADEEVTHELDVCFGMVSDITRHPVPSLSIFDPFITHVATIDRSYYKKLEMRIVGRPE